MGRIVVPGVTQGPDDMAREINRVVKQFLGRSRPFMFLVVNPQGDAMVLSNMDINEQRVKLLTEVRDRIRGN